MNNNKSASISTLFKNGVIFQNPVFVQLLGMCSALAITVSLKNALGMGAAVTFVLICSNVVISLLRKLIPSKIRIAGYIVVIAAFVTAVDMLIKAYSPALSASLGVFIPLIVVNCIILARAEAFASKNTPLASAIDGLSMGVGYTLALILVSGVRELLGSGTLFGFSVFGSSYRPVLMLIMPVGGFLTLGFLTAGFQWLVSRSNNKTEKQKPQDSVKEDDENAI